MAAAPHAKSRSTGPALLPQGHHASKSPIQLLRPVWVIGSRSNARLHLLSHTVSKAHALLVKSNGRFYICDLASRTKTIVNGEPYGEADLTDGDLITIGTFTFRYVAGPDESKPRQHIEPMLAKLEVSGSEYPIPIDRRVLLIGRRPSSDIHLLEDTVSTAHAVIFEMDGRWFIRDLGSRTGTFVNGVSTHQHRLSPGDTVHIGDTDLRFLLNEIAPAIVVDEQTEQFVDQPQSPPLEAPEEFEVTPPPPPGTPIISADLAPFPVAADIEPPEAPAEACLAAPLEEPPKFIAPPPLVRIEQKPVELPPLQPSAIIEDLPAIEEKPVEPLQPAAIIEDLPPVQVVEEKADTLPLAAPDVETTPSAEEIAAGSPPLELKSQSQKIPPIVESRVAPILKAVPPSPVQPPAKVDELKLPRTKPAELIEPVAEQASTLPLSAPDALVETPLEAPAAEPLPLVQANEIASPVEIIEHTEPTPQSALPQVAAEDLAIEALSAPADVPSVDALTDTTFDKDVRDFVGKESGELVETVAPAPLKLEPPSPTNIDKPPASPGNLVPWEANSENFVGGAAVEKSSPATDIQSSPVGDATMQELIQEIDTVAAAAEAAAVAPPPNETEEPPLILPSPRRRGPNVFRNVPRRRREMGAAPANGKSKDELHTSFDALGMTPVRQMDVFAQTSPPADSPSEQKSDSPQSMAGLVGSATAVAEEKILPSPRAVHPLLPEPIEGEIVEESRPAMTYAAELSEAEVAAIRKRYFRKVSALVAAMTLLIALCSIGIYNFLGLNSTVQGHVTFKNLSSLTQLERNNFQVEQIKKLKDDTTRRTARRMLNEKYPEIAPGFLDEQIDYFKTADRTTFSTANPDVMVLTVYGKDPSGDAARVEAMALAAYEANSGLLDNARAQQQSLEDLNKQIAQYQQQLAQLSNDIDKLRILGENSPTPEQLAQLDAQVGQLEKTWNDTVAAVKASQAELDRIKSAPAGDDAANIPAAPDDDKIKTMQTQLDDLQNKVNEQKAAYAEQASTAKKSLDAAIDGFAKQVADAQGMVNGNPAIAAYIDAAQKLQETTRQLTDDLIRRQEQQFGRLTELRERLNEKMEQRRVELWQGDKELQDLTERLAILTRQYNAAVGGGLKEADDLKTQVDLTKNMIKARQDLLPGDSFYADAIQQLQVIIDSTKKNIDEDRQKTDQVLTSLQQSFTSQQSVEKLPQEQKQLATAMSKQLDEINAARQQYNQAADAGAAEADSQLKSQMTALQAGIEARRKQLADGNLQSLKSQQEKQRLAAVDVKQAEFAKANQAELAARQAYFAKHKELRDAESLRDDAKANADKLDGMIRQKDVVQRSLEASLAQIDNKQREVNRAIEPIKPGDNDITIVRGEDRRLPLTLISGGTILVLFTGLILWTLHNAAIHAPPMQIHATDLRPLPKTGSNGHNGSEEDHEPAVA